MNRNAKVEGINKKIAESTADNLPKILENMRVTGFGVIRNFKKITRQTSLAMDVDSSGDEESASTARIQSVFQEGNEPDATQANFPLHQGGMLKGRPKTPNTFFCSKVLASIRTIMSSRLACQDRISTTPREGNHVKLWDK